MKLMRSDDIQLIPIAQLTNTDWDVRSTKEDEAGIIALRNSIKVDGIINPITVVKLNNKLQVVAGRRRLKAAKLAGLDEVPVYIKDDTTSLLAAKRIAMYENCHRKDMKDSERAKAFFMIFEEAGYKKQDIISGVKSIDNWFAHKKGDDRDWDELFAMCKSLTHSRDSRTDPLRYDDKFVEICRDTGFSPKYQYQIMQVLTQLKPDVLRYAETEKISVDNQIALTTSELRDHPKIQKELINDIVKNLPPKYAKTRIRQAAQDLKTGYITQNQDGTYTRGKGKKREKIKEGDSILPPLEIVHLDITKSANEFLLRMTDRAITKGEHIYSEKIVENTKNYRLSVVKASSIKGLEVMQNDLTMITDVSLDMLKLIEQEFESRKMKEKMTGK